jgi:Cu+-exporting ATPase
MPGEALACDGVILSCLPGTSGSSIGAPLAGDDTGGSARWGGKAGEGKGDGRDDGEHLLLVDESSLTGEARPVAKRCGDLLTSGSTLLATSSGGAVLVQAVRVGRNSTLALILECVQSSHLTLQTSALLGMADRLAARMVPGVVVLALVAGLLWWGAGLLAWVGTSYFGTELPAGLQALMFATCTLMVSCPCALGLASPLALVVGVGMGARKGVILRSARALETGASVTHVIFDKTGTLTEGQPCVKV